MDHPRQPSHTAGRPSLTLRKSRIIMSGASFAEKALHELGHDHVKTLHGSIDCSTFFRFEGEQRLELRRSKGVDPNSFIIGFVFRNQLRKSVPNILEGFKMFLQQEPQANAKLLLHTHWSEGVGHS